jgi:hypothetical protein
MDGKLTVPGLNYLAELSTTQVPVASGAGTIVIANNIATVTFAAAHGLTMTPAAGTAPNYFGTFSGVTGITGTGTLNGPIFRILSIPSTTTLTIYTTVTAATFTAGTFIPIFIMPGTAQIGSGFVNGPLMTGVAVPPAFIEACVANVITGPNCVVQYYPANDSFINDPLSGNTQAAPAATRTLVPVSSAGQVWFDGPTTVIAASGGAGTSRWSVIG